jgi:hypothetical protein
MAASADAPVCSSNHTSRQTNMPSTILRPLRISRFANCTPGVCATVIGALAGGDDSLGPVGWVLAMILIPAGTLLAVRGYRLSVRCDHTTITVYGLLRTRTILKASIIEITPFPAVRWQAPTGPLRWTPVSAFAESFSPFSVIREHNERSISRLRQCAGKG